MPSQDNVYKLYIDIAFRISQESKAIRRKVGAIIVQNNSIISYGYNGTPMGDNNECEHLVEAELVTKHDVIHAEMNAMYKAFNSGVKNATMYITDSPCLNCSIQIYQMNSMASEKIISEVIYAREYRLTDGVEYLRSKGVLVRKVDESILIE